MNKRILLFVIVGLICGQVVADAGQKPNKSDQPKMVCGISPKILTNDMVTGLSILLNDDPPAAVIRMIVAYDQSEKVLSKLQEFDKKFGNKKLSSDETKKLQEFVTKQLLGIVKPVREFFELLREYSSTLQPLIQESLDGRAGVTFEGSLLAKFMVTDKSKINTYFEDNVTSKDSLMKVCREFVVLFGDLECTLPNLFDKGRNFIAAQKTNKA